MEKKKKTKNKTFRKSVHRTKIRYDTENASGFCFLRIHECDPTQSLHAGVRVEGNDDAGAKWEEFAFDSVYPASRH